MVGGAVGRAGTVVAGGAAPVDGTLGATVLVATGGTGGAAGRGDVAGAGGIEAACCFPIIAFSTSPGLEMCERSIFVLIPSGSGRLERALFPPLAPSPEERKCARTFSASCSSSELECVFFSVTPTSGSTSRIALLLTSSSLARSLIRTLLIRLYVPPTQFPVKSSFQPHGFDLLFWFYRLDRA
jgi:hypothetical protein